MSKQRAGGCSKASYKAELTPEGLALIADRCEAVASELRAIYELFAECGGTVKVHLKMLDHAFGVLEGFEDQAGLEVRRLKRATMLEDLARLNRNEHGNGG
jgi:hypothetical protein